jgi:hypothetical protein
VLVISVLLVVGVVAGYAAVSSPELRGPYATPRPLPSIVHAPFTQAPSAGIAPAAISGRSEACVLPASVRVPTVFVGTRTYVYDRLGQSLIAIVPTSVSDPCPVFWGQPPNPIPDRIAR